MQVDVTSSIVLLSEDLWMCCREVESEGVEFSYNGNDSSQSSCLLSRFIHESWLWLVQNFGFPTPARTPAQSNKYWLESAW